ncbi:hypothetical protein BDZ85DRAFT_269276 [Elsinoe ampelina]|uniref:BTB domain-containing protein n=1 Tax=Elsinoe ampelina TaxID=302913 RepID=A0A6A6G0R4_9PEZI|nr:hypothetical protein BDZ85DRAFT_269276 [Elsinoe ampelina]
MNVFGGTTLRTHGYGTDHRHQLKAMATLHKKVKPKTSPATKRTGAVDNKVASSLKVPKLPTQVAQAPSVDDNGTTIISERGDLILHFEHEQGGDVHRARFQVDSITTRQASPYFGVLLDPSRFEEGRRVATTLATLRIQESAPNDSPPGGKINEEHAPQDLPEVVIEDIGRISPVKSIALLLTDFLRLLHSQPLVISHPPPLANLANLVAVFDRFSALPILESYGHTHHIFALLDAKSKPRGLPEDRLRQRAFVAYHLNHNPWLIQSTQRLIQTTAFQASSPADPAWADLGSLEDELHARRIALLDTIQSIQSFFLAQYSSRMRQCRLGYDSSAACDSYQLGEAVKFFSRSGTFSLSGSLLPDDDATPWEGDLLEILEKWKMCPEYQIDSNHHHCGIRTRLLPILERMERAIEDVGVCGDCWRDHRDEYAWGRAKGPLIWRRDEPARGTGLGLDRRCLNRHLALRDMCLAKDRVWY